MVSQGGLGAGMADQVISNHIVVSGWINRFDVVQVSNGLEAHTFFDPLLCMSPSLPGLTPAEISTSNVEAFTATTKVSEVASGNIIGERNHVFLVATLSIGRVGVFVDNAAI